MWLIAPLIFILAWVKSHSLSQSITESAAWCAGYMASAGVIIALNMGSIHIISEAPDGPGSIVPILVGFGFMWVSHMLWRRRGGHLQRRQVPLSRLAGRAYIAFRGDEAAKPAPNLGGYANVARRAAGVAQAASAGRPSTKPTPVSRQASSRPATAQQAPAAARKPPVQRPSASSSKPLTTTARSSSQPNRPKASKAKKAPAQSKSKTAGRLAGGAGHLAAGASRQAAKSDGAKKAMSNRWVRGSVRAMDAFLNDPKKGSKRAK